MYIYVYAYMFVDMHIYTHIYIYICATKRKMWSAFVGNCRNNLDTKNKFTLLQRAVLPCLDYRNTRWPAHNNLEDEIDALQRKMVGTVLRTRMRHSESVEAFFVRRRRLAGAACREHGL